MKIEAKIKLCRKWWRGRAFFKRLTTIITLSWNHHLETNTQKMSYRNAQLRRTVPTWYRKKLWSCFCS